MINKYNMTNFIRFIFIFICGMALASCAPADPSVNDLKSPCVASEFIEEPSNFSLPIPCVRRSPLENRLFV